MFNMTAEAEAAGEALHSANGHMTLKPDWDPQAKTASAGNNDHAFPALTGLEGWSHGHSGLFQIAGGRLSTNAGCLFNPA